MCILYWVLRISTGCFLSDDNICFRPMYAVRLTDLAYFFTKGRPSFRQNVAKDLDDFDNLTKTLVHVENLLQNPHYIRCVPSLRALLRGLLMTENRQIFLHILGICWRMLDKILAGFKFPVTEIRPFYQKLLF